MEIVLLHETGRAPHKTDHVPRHKERENCKISRDRQRKRERQKLANRPEIEKREADPKLWFSLAHCEPMASSKAIQWRRGIGKCTFTLQLSPPPSLHYLGDNKFPALRERAAEIRQLFPANTYVCRVCTRIKAHIQLNFMIRTAVHPPCVLLLTFLMDPSNNKLLQNFDKEISRYLASYARKPSFSSSSSLSHE